MRRVTVMTGYRWSGSRDGEEAANWSNFDPTSHRALRARGACRRQSRAVLLEPQGRRVSSLVRRTGTSPPAPASAYRPMQNRARVCGASAPTLCTSISGLASHLLGVAARWAADHGCDHWVIVTEATNPAGRIYRSVGFEPGTASVQAYRH